MKDQTFCHLCGSIERQHYCTNSSCMEYVKIYKSDAKVLRAIEATRKWLDAHKDSPSIEDFNFTIAGCERRNLNEYREILGQDKRKLQGRLRELYQAI